MDTNKHESETPKKPRKSELMAMKNGELLMYVQSTSSDPIAAAILKARWDAEPHHSLLVSDIRALERELSAYKLGRNKLDEIARLNRRISELEAENIRLLAHIRTPALRDNIKCVPPFIAPYPTNRFQVARMARIITG